MVNHARQLNYTQLRVQTAVHHRTCSARLLMNLLEHEVRITALLYLAQVHLQLLYYRSLLHTLKVRNLKLLTALYERNLLLAKIDHTVGVFYDGSGIGANQELIITHTYNQRAALACGNHTVRLSLIYNHYGVCAYHTVKSQRNGLLKRNRVAIHDILDKLYHNLGISLALKVVALVLELSLKRTVILYYTVVNERQISRFREMRMRIHIIGLAVSSPAGMRNTYVAAQIFTLHSMFQIGHLTLSLVNDQVAVIIYKRHTCAVITAVLQPGESLNQYGIRFTFTHITYYTTHSYCVLSIIVSIVYNRGRLVQT